jgi:hypothetical protein
VICQKICDLIRLANEVDDIGRVLFALRSLQDQDREEEDALYG